MSELPNRLSTDTLDQIEALANIIQAKSLAEAEMQRDPDMRKLMAQFDTAGYLAGLALAMVAEIRGFRAVAAQQRAQYNTIPDDE